MRHIGLLLGAFGMALALGGPADGGGAKVNEVGKDGLKITGKVSEDDGKVGVKVGDQEIPLLAKTYRVKLSAGKSYTITLKTDANDFDPFLVVQDKDGKQLAFDDDSGGRLNSKLVFQPTKDDTYKIYAASLGNRPGAYLLEITAAKGQPPQKARDVGKGLTIKGTINEAARTITYPVNFEEGKTYRIHLASDDFDAFLILQDPNGKRLAADDDSGGGLNSLINHRAATTGTYRIIASPLGGRGNGDFTLTVRESE
jgi:hypothetical protein